MSHYSDTESPNWVEMTPFPLSVLSIDTHCDPVSQSKYR